MKHISEDQLKQLRTFFPLSVVKKGKEKTGSVSLAVTERDTEFRAGSVASDSHLLDITSEQAVLSLVKNRNDLFVTQVVTILDAQNTQGGTILGKKVLTDYSIRIGKPIEYFLYDFSGALLLHVADVRDDSFYKPLFSPLSERLQVAPSLNIAKLASGDTVESELKKYAVAGVERNFSSSDSASGYGVSVLLEDGTVVFGGQYGSFDNRLGLHAEMSVVVDVLMNFPGKKITDLGLVSTKYEDAPCNICGVCLQFLAEMSARFEWNNTYHCFALKTDAVVKYTLDQLLPVRWTSKNW